MSISSERLAALQAMPFEEYVLTPEWQETRKRALKRDNYTCQHCSMNNVSLDVYHLAWNRLGEEDETDIITLCEDCYHALSPDPVEPVHLSPLWRIGIGLGGATATHITVALAAKGLFPLEVAGLIGSGFLGVYAPHILGQLKALAPKELGAWMEKQIEHKPGEWSGMDRLLGRHLHEAPNNPVLESPHNEQDRVEPDRVEPDQPAPLGSIFPRYRDDETLRLGQAIDKQALSKLVAANQARQPLPEVQGRRFEPHINSIYGLGVILAAAQGSGKSMLNGLFIEQAGACDSPVIIFDHKGEYPPVTELSYLRGLIAGGPSAVKKANKIGVPSFPLTKDNARAFVEMVFADHSQAVIMLPSYGDSWLARAEIVAAVGQALMQYAAKQREEEKLILPCLVFLDEAQLYIPENSNLLPPEAKENKPILNSLQNAFFSLVSNGRSNGYTMCFATQSLTYIAKWAIKSCQIKVLMRHVEHNDLNTCEEILGPKAIVKREDLETMPPGVGVVFNLTPKPLIVQFDRRESRDESETPGIERLRQARQEKTVAASPTEVTKIGDLSIAELATLLNIKQPEPEKQTETESLAISGNSLALGKDMSISREVFDIAVRLRRSGASTGYRDLMTTFLLSEHYAKLLNKLVEDAIKTSSL